MLVENTVRRLGTDTDRPRLDVVRDAALEVRRPTLFGELIIRVMYLPILALEGVEGRLFRPMALTAVFALFGSMVASLTLMPVLASLFVHGGHGENALVRGLQRLYRPVLRAALRSPALVVGVALLALANAAFLATRLGSEFVPRLGEGTVVINTIRLASVSLDESVRYGTQIERVLLERFPDEVARAWTRTGTAEVATDPMGVELSDVFVTLKPRETWTRAETQGELRRGEGVARVRAARHVPRRGRARRRADGWRAGLDDAGGERLLRRGEMNATMGMDRAAWLARSALAGEAKLTIGYPAVGGARVDGVGVAEESVALFGFGVDSWSEVASAVVVLWRLRDESAGRSVERERKATFAIGVLFLLLAVGIVVASAIQLAEGGQPASTVPGVIVSALSIGFIVFLWSAKKRTALALDSRTVVADAACSLACLQLSGGCSRGACSCGSGRRCGGRTAWPRSGSRGSRRRRGSSTCGRPGRRSSPGGVAGVTDEVVAGCHSRRRSRSPP